MEYVADLIGHQLTSFIGPGMLAVAGVAALVLISGLGARIVETCETLQVRRPSIAGWREAVRRGRASVASSSAVTTSASRRSGDVFAGALSSRLT